VKQAYIGLGANLDQPVAQIEQALVALAQSDALTLLDWSGLYQSKPMGPQDQPDYINAVALIETDLPPLQLLDVLQQQEQAQGRERKRHWGERTLDLDLLLYDDQCIQNERLTVPHTGLMARSFVIVPLLEVTPNLRLPDGRCLSDAQANCPDTLTYVGRSTIDI
jgi:2-amino-4-hydroxy-6-hydroxymethyldihydropteridine diphosphokinase